MIVDLQWIAANTDAHMMSPRADIECSYAVCIAYPQLAGSPLAAFSHQPSAVSPLRGNFMVWPLLEGKGEKKSLSWSNIRLIWLPTLWKDKFIASIFVSQSSEKMEAGGMLRIGFPCCICGTVMMVLLASGCASSVAVPTSVWSNPLELNPAAPSSREIGVAFSRPRLQSCDDLACYYSLSEYYVIRDLSCRVGPAAVFVCDYERAKTKLGLLAPIPVSKRRRGIARPEEEETPLVWNKARSSLSRGHGGSWQIVSDKAFQEDPR